jgi:hypothetical protein
VGPTPRVSCRARRAGRKSGRESGTLLPDNAAALVGAGVLSVIVCDLTLDPDRSGRKRNPKLVPAASAALQARAAYVSVQASLNHDLDPSVGDARIRVDRCPTTYSAGAVATSTGRATPAKRRAPGAAKPPTAPAISSAVAQTADGWLAQLRACRVALTIMLDDLGRFDCSVEDGVDADSEPSSPLLALAGLVGLGGPSQHVA